MKTDIRCVAVIMICMSSAILAVGQQMMSTNGAAVLPGEVSASNQTGTISVRWRMPLRDSAFVFDAVQGVDDTRFRDTLAKSFHERWRRDGEVAPAHKRGILGLKSVERAKADFVIDRDFTDQQGTHGLYLKMPGNQAIGVLKAAFFVGDSRFKYQVMRFGFQRYENEGVRADLLVFLASGFDEVDALSKGEVMFFMFAMDPRSPHTRVVLEKAETMRGDGRVEDLIRGAGRDLLEYLRTGDSLLLSKYHMKF